MCQSTLRAKRSTTRKLLQRPSPLRLYQPTSDRQQGQDSGRHVLVLDWDDDDECALDDDSALLRFAPTPSLSTCLIIQLDGATATCPSRGRREIHFLGRPG